MDRVIEIHVGNFREQATIRVRPEDMARMESTHDFHELVKMIVRYAETINYSEATEMMVALKLGVYRAKPVPVAHKSTSTQINRIARRRIWLDKFMEKTELAEIWEGIEA